MSLILGIEYCKVDSNGRFKFPIALKKQLEDSECRFAIRQSIYAECLELWPYASFKAEVEHLQKILNPYNVQQRDILRKLTEGNIIELDSNDRLLIPTEQKAKINNAKDIVLQSTGRFIEIWARDAYDRRNAKTANFAAEVDAVLGSLPKDNEQ